MFRPVVSLADNIKAVTFFIAFPCRPTYTTPLVLNWSPDQVIARWKISVDLFSRLFLADGPGAERDSFLAARAGVAGRLARYACAFGSGKVGQNYMLISPPSRSLKTNKLQQLLFSFLLRFRRAASYLRESITSESQQLGVYGGLGGRVGTTLSLSIKRQKIQENTLRILGEVMFMAPHKLST